MTTLQYLQRVARRTRDGDFTRLALTEQMDVLEAANSALMRLYNALPSYLREQTQGFTLPAPVTLYNVPVVNGSETLTTGIFNVNQIGCTVLIAGDPAYNQILGTDNLRNPYNGPTGTAATLQIYGDALYSTTYPFDRIIGNPRFTDTGFSPLVPNEMSRSEGEWTWLFQCQLGRPMTWGVQYLGNSQGNNPMMVVRFAPLPDIAYSIKIRMSFWPLRLLLQDVQGATTLGVPDQFLETSLIPMAIKELMTKPCYKSAGPDIDKMLLQQGIDAVAFAELQVADPAAPSNRIYCPLGY